jgi:hypothetical protein
MAQLARAALWLQLVDVGPRRANAALNMPQTSTHKRPRIRASALVRV